jgi:hypothetical protein
VTASPGALSVLGVLRLMFWQLPWSVAVASATAWGWLLSQAVVAPAGMMLSRLTTQQPTPAATPAAATSPASVGSALTEAAGSGQAGQVATSWCNTAAAGAGNGLLGADAGTGTDSVPSSVQAAGVGGGEAAVEQAEAESPRVGSMRWLRRGRATGPVPPTPAPSLEVRGGRRCQFAVDLQSAFTPVCLRTCPVPCSVTRAVSSACSLSENGTRCSNAAHSPDLEDYYTCVVIRG